MANRTAARIWPRRLGSPSCSFWAFWERTALQDILYLSWIFWSVSGSTERVFSLNRKASAQMQATSSRVLSPGLHPGSGTPRRAKAAGTYFKTGPLTAMVRRLQRLWPKPR
ncbi:hypothetical protein HYQ46_011784 [Verticillium longisporum]|nr:hypothetical protein HYQ46_011784 [Verticillium longisporum]